MHKDDLRHLAHGEHSDIDGAEPAQKTRKLKGVTTASGRNALEAGFLECAPIRATVDFSTTHRDYRIG